MLLWCLEIVLIITVSPFFTSATDICTLGSFGCYSRGGNLLETKYPIPNIEECQALCIKNLACEYFTYYSNNQNLQLSHTCFLFSSCDRYNTKCTNCTTGSRTCVECRLPPARGGHNFCFHNATESLPGNTLPELGACHYTCGQRLTTRHCLNGGWVGPEPSCPCNSAPPGTQLTCTEPPEMGQYGAPWPYDLKGWPGDMVCRKLCGEGQEAAGQTVCRDGQWDVDLSKVTCSSQDNSLVLVIILTVVGGLALILLTAGTVWLCIYRRRRRRGERDGPNPPIKGFGSEASIPTVRENVRSRFEAYRQRRSSSKSISDFLRISAWSTSENGDRREARDTLDGQHRIERPWAQDGHGHAEERWPRRDMRTLGSTMNAQERDKWDGAREGSDNWRREKLSPPPPPRRQARSPPTYPQHYSDLLRREEQIGRPIKTWY